MPYRVVRAEVVEEAQREHEDLDSDSEEARDHPGLLSRAFDRFEQAGWTLTHVIPRVPTVMTDQGGELATPHTASFVFHKDD